jgi:hypothetical protein
MSGMEDTFEKVERKKSQAAKRKLAEKRAGRALLPKPPKEETNIVTLKYGGKSEKIIQKKMEDEDHDCFECGVCFVAGDPLFCVNCTYGIVVVGEGTPIKYHPPQLSKSFLLFFLLSFLELSLGLCLGKRTSILSLCRSL